MSQWVTLGAPRQKWLFNTACHGEVRRIFHSLSLHFLIREEINDHWMTAARNRLLQDTTRINTITESPHLHSMHRIQTYTILSTQSLQDKGGLSHNKVHTANHYKQTWRRKVLKMIFNFITQWTILLLALGVETLSCHTLPDHMIPLQGHCFLLSSEHTSILAACFWIPKKEQVMEKRDGKEREFFSGLPQMQHISLRLRNASHIQDCVNSFLDMTHGVLLRSSLGDDAVSGQRAELWSPGQAKLSPT